MTALLILATHVGASTVWTDGSILPRDAMAYGAMILRDHFSLFVDFEEPIEREPR